MEELGVAADTIVGACSLGFELLVDGAIRPLGAGFAENAVLLGSELGFPLFIRELDWLCWSGSFGAGELDFIFGLLGMSGLGAHRFLLSAVHEEEGQECCEEDGRLHDDERVG